MFHNLLMSSLTALGDIDEVHCWDNRPFTTKWPEIKQEKVKDTGIKKTIKKKNKRNRTMFTTEQVRVLEDVFARSRYIDVERRKEIAECLRIDQKCIKIWFQNRRMKEKKEVSENCDSTNESVAESVSPSLEVTQPPHRTPETYLSPDNHAKSYYYYTQNTYPHTVTPHNIATIPNIRNNSESPLYTNQDSNTFSNYAGYAPQYYENQTGFNNVYNIQYMNRSNFQDWSVNNYDFNYY